MGHTYMYMLWFDKNFKIHVVKFSVPVGLRLPKSSVNYCNKS